MAELEGFELTLAEIYDETFTCHFFIVGGMLDLYQYISVQKKTRILKMVIHPIMSIPNM